VWHHNCPLPGNCLTFWPLNEVTSNPCHRLPSRQFSPFVLDLGSHGKALTDRHNKWTVWQTTAISVLRRLPMGAGSQKCEIRNMSCICLLFFNLYCQKQFSGNISINFAQILKLILLLNSANFCTLDKMDKIKFWNSNFLWLWTTPFGGPWNP